MSLGPQCWRCRKKRLRCDSSNPGCQKCNAANVECPGYGEKRPIAWRDPLVLTKGGIVRIKSAHASNAPAPASITGITYRSPVVTGSEMDLRIAANAMEYYNHHVAPDLVPYSTQRSPYEVSARQFETFADYIRHAYVSIAALHRHISGEPFVMSNLSGGTPPASPSVAHFLATSGTPASGRSILSTSVSAGDYKSMYFASQAAALKALGEELCKYQLTSPGDSSGSNILLGIFMVLSSQIQFSAYAPWEAHIQGAWSLVQTHGGFDSVAASDVEYCRLLHQFAILDIFGVSTLRLAATSARSIIIRHDAYSSMFNGSDDNVANPWKLVPNDFAKVLIQVNVLRARKTLASSMEILAEDVLNVLDLLKGSSAADWAIDMATGTVAWEAPSQLSEDEETKVAWRALVTAYHSAITLYAINSLARPAAKLRDLVTSLVEKELRAYDMLLSSLRVLFDQRILRHKHDKVGSPGSIASSAGLLHKFVIWPMVVGGIQSALVYGNDEETRFLCSGMQAVGEELGTVSMIDGARLVERLQLSKKHGRVFLTWDELFDGSPLFLM